MLNYREVDDKFAISGGWYDIERDIAFLKSKNITAILDMEFTDYSLDRREASKIAKICKANGIEYTSIPMEDSLNYSYEYTEKLIRQGTDKLIEYVDKHNDSNSRILVKCAAGISRSTTMYLSYTCHANKISFSNAYRKLQRIEFNLLNNGKMRWGAMPNNYFQQILNKIHDYAV